MARFTFPDLEKARQWVANNRFLIIAAGVSIFSSPGDGGYISRFIGPAMGYGINFMIDGVTEFLAHQFMTIRADTIEGKARDRRRFLSWLFLFPFAIGMNYFAVVFAHAQYALLSVELGIHADAFLLWSLAAFSPAALLGLAVAQAFVRPKGATRSKPEPVEIEQDPTSLPPRKRREALLDLLLNQPEITQEDAGDLFGVSRQTISGDMRTLEKQGKIKRNGSGVVVV